MNKSIEIKKYTDVLQYFQDYFKYRKSVDKKFSYDVWAAELGFKSRSYMRMISYGDRTITPKFVSVFSEKMGFSSGEEQHLSLIVSYQQARGATQKQLYHEKILENLETSETQYDIKDYLQFLSSPHLSALLLLISFDDIEATNSVLQDLLNISAAELKENLKTLKNLGLIEQKGKVWVSQSKSFMIEEKQQEQAVAKFHKETLTESARILKDKDLFKRFRTIFFSLAEEDCEEFKNEIELFLTKMKRKYGSNYIQNKKLIKLNLQAYPVSSTYKK